MEETILIPDAPKLIESTRSIGYSFESAMADIIDNSIAKAASTISVEFSSSAPQYIAFIDDGCGMNSEELIAAMKYGSSDSLDDRDKDDLGRFGLGMKMASLSQCRKLTVISSKSGELSAVQWDLDYINQTGKWTLKVFNRQEMENLRFHDVLKMKKSGTVVLWEDFDRLLGGASDVEKVFDEKMQSAKRHIALVFHRFMGAEIPSRRVTFLFNGRKLEALDPFLVDNPGTQPLEERIIQVYGTTIRVKPYILPYLSKIKQKDKLLLGDTEDLRHDQGFYIYRNRRLIIKGTWFGLRKKHELSKLTRIRVDIPNSLDALWKIDIKKSTASIPDIIKKNLRQVVEASVPRSENVSKYRGRTLGNDDIQHTWKTIDNRGSIQYQINRELPVLKKLESCLSESDSRYLDEFLCMIEDTLPFSDIYYRMAKGEEQAKGMDHPSVEQEKVYCIARDTISQLEKEEIAVFLDEMSRIDFFMKYPEVIERIKKEFGK